MIKNIRKLQHFGIFQSHTNANAKDFGRYNLFYGWNGSGKSTLSELFRCIENKVPSKKFASSKFIVSIDSGSEITEANIAESDLNVYTFNRDFIDENISWDGVVKSILIVDKAKIEEHKTLVERKEAQQIDSEAHGKEAKGIENLQSSISTFKTNTARNIKASLQSIDTTDRYYLNYDKRKFKDFIEDNLEITKTDDPLLDEDKIIELTNAAKPDQKNPINFHQQTINRETFTQAKKRLDDLLKTSVASQTIQRLVEHVDIKSWVETGLDLHKHHNTNQCEFCGNTVTEERIRQLEAHFNDHYKAFQDELVSADGWLAGLFIQPPVLPASSDFYEEFKQEYSTAHTALEKAKTDLNEEISAWRTILKEKTANPLETGITVEAVKESSIKVFNDAMNAISAAVGKHNHKSGNFQEETNTAKRRLELHYTTTEVKAFDYHNKKKAVVDRTNANRELGRIITTRNTEIQSLENAVSNEGLGADQFNASLGKFLGRSDLTLRFNSEKKGYEILRNHSVLVDGNLSEGEKTAIAFVYFITKLKENGNNIGDTIVVVDDPVSSFDSQHLFHAYSFMNMNCKEAKQLFVLTHSFVFFKLVRDWNKKNCYMVEANNESPRTATYTDAEPALTKYNSEYHYIFSKLYFLKNQPPLNSDDHFLAANLSRKLLETFLSFKFPGKRNFSELFRHAVSVSANTTDEDKEKILKFVHKYSHNDLIATNEDFVENLIGENVSVISDIFDWIKELDETHYEEMIEVSKS